MTTILKAYYDGAVFVPMIPVDIQTGKIFEMSILQENASVLNVGQIAAFKQITDNLHKINDVEPLSDDFDTILSQRVHFKDISLWMFMCLIQISSHFI